ncbi:putative SnoaL-like aldol condensation-catalyzing enzyme [Mucilaginibacter frigoritolerans]|uniref:Putative SnoaL-like aldol condensation-catalyzing enzyme n=1 Tax=Mucilaginibacter frigoritolerans TaxID=652788 RepID=A0A562TRS7_9SPHI|nr:nuclear transport factor 2 family protein [Mucilaginibacter frigoritolerans]TWI96299.1 putative SnoaL-like aldol condensation-catalyzing enzyme [Mucilaginibacter frigoritolerans]
METKSNKTIVLECYRKIIRDLDLSLVDEYIREDYIQHSPTVKDGKAGILEMLHFLKSLPQPKEHGPSPIIRTIAEGNMVAVHLDVQFMGKRVAVVDLFRLQEGKIAEHWDASMMQPEKQDGLIIITNGTAEIDQKIDPSVSKKLVNEFYQIAFGKGDPILADRYVAKNYLDHDPDGRLLKGLDYLVKIHRLIAEGDFVVAQCELISATGRYASYDIFRIAGDKIVEHWCVEQEVPQTMAHNNGMF